MTTLDDQASDQEEKHRKYSIAEVRARNQPIKYRGRCLFCNAQVELERWCPGGECKEDWEQEQRIRQICKSRR